MKTISVYLFAPLLLLQSLAYGDKPVNIVSLDLCTDWMLLTYALPGQVKAYSPYLYQYPNGWIEPGLPTHNGSLEQVVALKPDLVISGEFNALLLRERLQQLKFSTEVLPNPDRLEQIESYIQRVQHLLQVDLSKDTDKLQVVIPSMHKTLLLLGANGIGTGRETLEHDIITAAGWDNYLTLPGYVALDLEKLVSHSPDAIFLAAPESLSLAGQFARHRALSHRFSSRQWVSHDSWRWQCPGPWTYQLIQELATWKKP